MFGKYNNTASDGGYTLRNLKIDGMGALSHPQPTPCDERRQRDHRFTSRAAFADEATHGGVDHVTISRNIISRNRGMGILGQVNDSVIEDNLFEGNSFSGSDYDHAVYLSGNDSGGRNNMFRHNAVVNGVCWGGNVTGQMDCMLIEGNTIEQRASVRR